MKKRVLLVVLALVLAVSLVACSTAAPAASEAAAAPASEAPAAAPASEAPAAADAPASEAPAAAEAPASGEPIANTGGIVGGLDYVTDTSLDGSGQTYYMITFASGLDFWKGCYAGFQRAANLVGASTEYTGTEGNDPTDQARILEQVAGTKPAGIAITAVNSEALAEPINNVMAAGIPVVTFDSNSTQSKTLSFLALDNYNAGRVAGDALAGFVGGKGVISGTLVPGAQNLEDRWRGVRDIIGEKYPDITIIDPVNGEYSQETGAAQVSALLAANPEITGLFASDASAGVAVGTALTEMGKTNADVKVLAFDTEPGTMQMLKDGILAGALVQGRESMGFWAFQFLFAVNNNLIVGAKDWQANSPLPPTVDTGITVITPETVDNYQEDWSNWNS